MTIMYEWIPLTVYNPQTEIMPQNLPHTLMAGEGMNGTREIETNNIERIGQYIVKCSSFPGIFHALPYFRANNVRV